MTFSFLQLFKNVFHRPLAFIVSDTKSVNILSFWNSALKVQVASDSELLPPQLPKTAVLYLGYPLLHSLKCSPFFSPSLRDSSPALPVFQCLKTVASYIQSGFLLA